MENVRGTRRQPHSTGDPDDLLPVDIVLAPAWWYANCGITFDRDLFFHPLKRVETEQKMEQMLYDRWGAFGLGESRAEVRPEVGAVHLAAGFLVQEMLGCDVIYSEGAPPQVIPADDPNLLVRPDEAFLSFAYRDFEKLLEALSSRFGYATGDVNWSGVLNIALDLHGQAIFTDLYDRSDEVDRYFRQIANTIERFVERVEMATGTSSISVNRNVRHLPKPVFLHSECSHTMISTDDYDRFLAPIDAEWSRRHRPYGIHFCGADPHRFAESFARLPHLDFLDLGWGGDVALLRSHLPDTFFNIRLSPVELVTWSPDQVRETVARLVNESGDLRLTGVCCINMDEKVPDENITAIFEAVEELKRRHGASDR